MSRSRVRKRHIKSLWNIVKSTTAPETPPETILEVPYTDTAGIWNLRATTQFPKIGGNGPVSYTLVAHTSIGQSATIGIPAAATAGDIAILFDCNVGEPVTPAGWTPVLSYAAVFDVTISYRILESGDSVVSGHTSTYYAVKHMFIFRPSSSIRTVTLGGVQNSNSTSFKAATRTMPAHIESPCIMFGFSRAFTNEPFRDESWGTEYSLMAGNNYVKVYYEIQTTAAARTLTQSADYGSYNHTIGFSLSAS